MQVEDLKLMARINVASISEIQKSPSKRLKGITRVIRGSETVGYFFEKKEFDELVEKMVEYEHDTQPQ